MVYSSATNPANRVQLMTIEVVTAETTVTDMASENEKEKSMGVLIRASVDALCRDGAGEISRDRLQRGRLTRQGTTS